MDKKEKSKLRKDMKKEFPKSRSGYKFWKNDWVDLFAFSFLPTGVFSTISYSALDSMYSFNNIYSIPCLLLVMFGGSYLITNGMMKGLYNNKIKYLTSTKYSDSLVPLNK